MSDFMTGSDLCGNEFVARKQERKPKTGETDVRILGLRNRRKLISDEDYLWNKKELI